MTETVAPPVVMASDTNAALAKRVAKLERRVKRMRAHVRALDPTYDFEISPEWEAEIERRIKDADENPGASIPWEEVKAKLQAEFGFQ